MSSPKDKKKSERPPARAAMPALLLDLDEVAEKLGNEHEKHDTENDKDEAREDADRPTVAPPFDLESFAKEGAVNSRASAPSVTELTSSASSSMRAPQATLTDETALENAREQSKLSNFPIVNSDNAGGSDSILSLANSRSASIVPPAARPAHAWTAIDRGWGEDLDEAGKSEPPSGGAAKKTPSSESTPMPGFAAPAPLPHFQQFPDPPPTTPSLGEEAPTSKRPLSAEPPPPPAAGADSKRTPTLRPSAPTEAGPSGAPDASETTTAPPAKPFVARRKTQMWGAADLKSFDSNAPSSNEPSGPPATGVASSSSPVPPNVQMPDHTTPFPTSKGAREIETARAETQAVASSSPVTLAAGIDPSSDAAITAPRVTPVAMPKAETIAATRKTDDEIEAARQRSQSKTPVEMKKATTAESIVPVTQASEMGSAPPPTRKAAADPVLEMKERFSLGDYTGALVIAEALIEDAQPGDALKEAKEYAESCRQVLQQMYTARIGPLDRIPMVMVPRDQLRWLSIDHKAGFVLSHVDGISSLEMILDVSGMPTLDTLRILCELAQQRIISFR